jgi:hypothetical protein
VDKIFDKWNSTQTPGVAVSVVKDGEIIFKQGYGMANLEYDIPVTPSTIFHIASVSKQFTVFSILLLEKDGKLSMDDDIRKFIPEVPDFGKTITLRHLATHTSGLRDQWNLLALAGWRLDDVITREQVMKLISAQKELNFDPGEEFLYCNTGFTLLAEVVSRVSGQSFSVFTEVGNYELKSGTLFYVSDRDDKLYIQAFGELEFLLKPVSDNRFVIAEAEIEIEFLNEENSLTQAVRVYYSDKDTEEGKRVAPFDPSSVNLEDFEGTFFSDELSTSYHFEVKDDQLVATHSRHSDIYFQAVKKDLFRAESWFFGQAEFIRNESGVVVGMKATSGRARNIKFDKKD